MSNQRHSADTCAPIANANVEIWQACESGRYNNPRDPNPAPLDPNFQYWGETYTSEEGEYIFKTIIPGEYPAAEGWVRPPHIHFRVAKLGYNDLVTQMYFKGNPLNDDDRIIKAIPQAERASVIVEFAPSGPQFEPSSLTGVFDISLVPVR
jgi:protocatechuate 3,4-dioxygenase, beta subunit